MSFWINFFLYMEGINQDLWAKFVPQSYVKWNKTKNFEIDLYLCIACWVNILYFMLNTQETSTINHTICINSIQTLIFCNKIVEDNLSTIAQNKNKSYIWEDWELATALRYAPWQEVLLSCGKNPNTYQYVYKILRYWVN